MLPKKKGTLSRIHSHPVTQKESVIKSQTMIAVISIVDTDRFTRVDVQNS